MKIIITDDNLGHVTLIKIYLREKGIDNEIVRFENGMLLVEAIENGAFISEENILLLDLRMPVMDGFEVLQYLKEHSLLERLYTIVLSTSDSQEDICKCKGLGCHEYFSKSAEFGSLVNRMEEILAIDKF